MATYPASSLLPAGTNETEVNPTNYNLFVDNINALTADLAGARADTQDFAGTDHTTGQSTDIQDMLESIRHQLAHAIGMTNWYDQPTNYIDLHPEYPGEVLTLSLRGAAVSGNNVITRSSDEDVVSNVARHYHEVTSDEASMQDGYVAVRLTLPKNFTAWATSSAIQIEFKTESGTSANNFVNVYIYQSGDATVAASSENNTGTSWGTITLDDSVLDSAHSWAAGDIMEIYIKLASRNNYYARVGKIKLNYQT